MGKLVSIGKAFSCFSNRRGSRSCFCLKIEDTSDQKKQPLLIPKQTTKLSHLLTLHDHQLPLHFTPKVSSHLPLLYYRIFIYFLKTCHFSFFLNAFVEFKVSSSSLLFLFFLIYILLFFGTTTCRDEIGRMRSFDDLVELCSWHILKFLN